MSKVRDRVKRMIVGELAKCRVSVVEQVRLWYGAGLEKCHLELRPETDDDVVDVAVELYAGDSRSDTVMAELAKLGELSVESCSMEEAWDRLVYRVLPQIKCFIVKSRSETPYGAVRYTERRVKFPRRNACRTLEEFAIRSAAEGQEACSRC